MSILWFLLIGALVVIPFFKLLPKYDLNPWWALVAVIPVGLIVLLWIMASKAEN